LLHAMLSVVWQAETTPAHWHVGVITSLHKKGDRQNMDNYRGISLLSVVGKVYNKIISNRLTIKFDLGNKLHEAQNGFRRNRGCPDHVLTLSQILLGRKKQGLQTHCFFLDIKKAYDSVWRNGLWHRLWQMGIRGKMWRVIKNMYNDTKNCVSMDNQLGEMFNTKNGVAQGDTLSPLLFSLFINGLLQDLQAKGLGLTMDDTWLGALMFADDFVGICESAEDLQKMIDALYSYSQNYRFQANVAKCAVVVFGDSVVPERQWTWGNEQIPVEPSYVYLGVNFVNTCDWDGHALMLVREGNAKCDKLKHVFLNKQLSIAVKRTILQTVLKPSLAYAGEVWEPSAGPAKQLETVFLKGCKTILQCGMRASAEPVRADLGLMSLKADRIVSKLVYKRKVDQMPDSRYPKLVTSCVWRSSQRGRQTRMWSKVIEDLQKKYVLSHNDVRSTRSDESFVQAVKDSVLAHETMQCDMDMRTKPKLHLYSEANEGIGFKPYLHGKLDLGTKLMFKFRSGNIDINGVNDTGASLRQHCPCCNAECESITHALTECPFYQQHRTHFINGLRSFLPVQVVEHFLSKPLHEQAVSIISANQWPEQHQASVSRLAKEFMCRVCHCRDQKLQGSMEALAGRDSDAAQPNHGAASSGGAEVYGHMTTAPN
jgi:Reverse transcriptase (RNA-dependent DNA polymerase)